MAPGARRTAVGLSRCNDYKEVNPLNLGAEHVPFPCSLRELVLDRYAEPPGVGGNAHPMRVDELVEYLKEIDDFSISPWVAIIEKTEAIGDPATPSREQTAALRWLGKALELWEKQFPLEGRLATQVRRLKPLSAALAITDPKFMQPGAHPLHQLLDTIQARAIGWQSRLDRVGTALEQQVIKAIDESRGWFDDNSRDLTGVCSEFSAAAERDQARAQRMIQRVVETEAGKARTAAAKQEAARMINAALEKYPAPEEIGEFVKGPWYTSAQLLLLKFGADSEHWQNMSATTETLLDSLQSLEDVQDQRRQHIFEVVTQLPKDMRRWLLSLHHDTEAVNEAMGLVEYAHLHILRGQPIDLQSIEPIVVESEHVTDGAAEHLNALKKWSHGQWFSVDSGTGSQRVQLVLKTEPSQQLLFTNMAGIKALQLSYSEFSQLMAQRKVVALYSGASFSLCLAQAAGVDSVEILAALASAMGVSISEPAAEPEPEPELTPKQELEQLLSEHTGKQKSEQVSEEMPEQEPEQPPEQEDSQQQDIVEFEPEEQNDTPEYSLEQKEEPPASGKADKGFLSDQAEEIKAQEGHVVQQPAGSDAESIDFPKLTAFEEESRKFISENVSEGVSPDQSVVHGDTDEREINLPMGVWIGFHDGETPMMARLAVHDPDDDNFIFVNRKGVKIRQVSRQEMLTLIDQGLLEILEAKSNLKKEVT